MMRTHRSDTMDFQIRTANAGELGDCQAIERSASTIFPEALFPLRLRHDAVGLDVLQPAQAEGRLWVATAEAEALAGFILMGEMDGDAFVRELDVRPEFGRRGIGAALMRTGIAWAR